MAYVANFPLGLPFLFQRVTAWRNVNECTARPESAHGAHTLACGSYNGNTPLYRDRAVLLTWSLGMNWMAWWIKLRHPPKHVPGQPRHLLPFEYNCG